MLKLMLENTFSPINQKCFNIALIKKTNYLTYLKIELITFPIPVNMTSFMRQKTYTINQTQKSINN